LRKFVFEEITLLCGFTFNGKLEACGGGIISGIKNTLKKREEGSREANRGKSSEKRLKGGV
jgi:hypothetical protein